MKPLTFLTRVCLWAIGFYFCFALLDWMTGREIDWIGMIFFSICVSLVFNALKWVYEKKFGKKTN